jgi:hypothetical protein
MSHCRVHHVRLFNRSESDPKTGSPRGADARSRVGSGASYTAGRHPVVPRVVWCIRCLLPLLPQPSAALLLARWPLMLPPVQPAVGQSGASHRRQPAALGAGSGQSAASGGRCDGSWPRVHSARGSAFAGFSDPIASRPVAVSDRVSPGATRPQSPRRRPPKLGSRARRALLEWPAAGPGHWLGEGVGVKGVPPGPLPRC